MNYDIVEEITNNIYRPIKIIEWFNMKYIDIENVINNIGCTSEFLDKNKKMLNYNCWKNICSQSRYSDFIEKHYDILNNELRYIVDNNKVKENNDIEDILDITKISQINLLNICKNLNKYKKYIDYIDVERVDSTCCYYLYKDPLAIELIRRYINIYDIKDELILYPLVQNKEAIDIIKLNINNLNYILWQILCMNENAIDMIIENMDKIHMEGFYNLALNKNPRVMEIISNNLDKIYNDQKFWKILSGNPNIFILDDEELNNNIDINMKYLFSKFNI